MPASPAAPAFTPEAPTPEPTEEPTEDPTEDPESTDSPEETESMIAVQVDPADTEDESSATGIRRPTSAVDIAVSVALAAGGISVLGGLWFGFRGLLSRF